jgi:hypothetical protein
VVVAVAVARANQKVHAKLLKSHPTNKAVVARAVVAAATKPKFLDLL